MKFKNLALIGATISFNWSSFPLVAFSQETRLSPEQLNQLTFADLIIGGEGSSIGFESDVDNTSPILQPGTPLSEIIQLGDLEATLSPQNLTVGEILARQSLRSKDITLERFPLLGRQTLSELVDAVPGLGERSVNSVAFISQLLRENNISADNGSSIDNLVEEPGIGELEVNSLDLSSFNLDEIPRLEESFLGDFADFESSLISEVPGLSELPFGFFPNPLNPIGQMLARIDLIWSEAESERVRTISGSYLEGFKVPCETECAHLELDDLENMGIAAQASFEGSQWISGLFQKVGGGTGCLTGLTEPTGIHPFGPVFKVVLWSTDETTDLAEIVLFFRFGTFCGFSPYVLGPIFFPGNEVHINDLVFIGNLPL